MDLPMGHAKKNPRDNEGFFSNLTFSFMEPLFRLDRCRKLEISDMFKAGESETVQESGTCLQSEWAKEVDKRKNGREASLGRAMIRAYWRQYAMTGFLIIFRDALRFLQPILLERLLMYFSRESNIGRQGALLIVVTMGTCNVIQSLVGPHVSASLIYCWHRWRAGVVGLLYRKVLLIHQDTMDEIGTGHITELITSDADKFGELIWHIHTIWILPLHLSVCMYLVYCHLQVGWPILAGLIFVLLALPIQAYLIFKSEKDSIKQHEKTDERISMMSEVISGMRVIKMYCWEKPFGKLIDALRQSELSLISKVTTLETIHNELGTMSESLLICVVLATFVIAQNGIISATKVFPMISILGILSDTVLEKLPSGMVDWMQVSVSAKRIQDFLLLPEIMKNVSNIKTKEPSIDIDNMTASLKRTEDMKQNDSTVKTILKNINLKVRGNKLVAIVGPVGSGKSSLLMAFMNELSSVSGTVTVKGSMSYAKQEPWIFSSTIRKNILFGKEYNPDKYGKVLRASALLKDLDELPFGDKLLVGDNGVTLSGGQKARISLARALYADADIVLLDDPLSAVDAEVANSLFTRCVKGYLRNKLRILCTHQTQFLPDVDYIIVLDKTGQVEAQGTYEDIKASGNKFIFSENVDRHNVIQSKPENNEEMIYLGDEPALNKQMSQPSDEKQEDEDKFVGKITWRSYKDFFTVGTSYTMLAIIYISSIMAQAAGNLSSWWLSYWTNLENKMVTESTGRDTCPAFNFIEGEMESMCSLSSVKKENWTISAHLGILIYLGLTLLEVTISFTKAMLYNSMTLRSSRIIHDRMYNSVIRSPVRFYDSNPKGRIINRFASDLGSLDGRLPELFMNIVQVFLSLVGDVTVIIFLNPWTLLPVPPLAIRLSKLRNKFSSLQKRFQKYHSETNSSMVTHLNSTLDGITTIRAFNFSEICLKGFESRFDNITGSWCTDLALWSWYHVHTNFIIAVFKSAAVFIITFLSADMNAAEYGLALSYIAPILSTVDYLVRKSARMELQMIKSERILSYTKLKPEAELTSLNTLDESWPAKGQIEMKNVNFKYHEASPNVLKNLNLTIQAGSKVGIVGRTGAGKSSIIQALFRMAEPEGEIEIDGVTATDIGLHELRSKLSIIPQDPVLFKGSIRYNIDPFNEFTDEKIFNVLNEVQLGSMINEIQDGIYAEVTEGGNNFSVGQKQLFCLARAILKNNKILLIDEATANVDARTDELIQKTIRETFSRCTVITIAHRINTILNSDKILVMADGQMVEYASPESLLQNPKSHFTKLVASSGLNVHNNI